MTSINLFRNAKDAVSFTAGQVICREGEPGDVMYVVTEGEVNILLGDQILDVLGPGGIFGEMALIDSSPRSASAIAKTDCKLVPVSRQRFTFLVQQTPYFSLEVMHVMAERLRRIMRAQRRAEESP